METLIQENPSLRAKLMIIEVKARQPFSLSSVINSHGWADLPPFQKTEGEAELSYILRLSNHQHVQITISSIPGGVSVEYQEGIQPSFAAEITSAVTWMLALNDDFTEFYERAKNEPQLSHVEQNAQGRLLRSQTLFEDTIKTILTTNTSWSGTIRMTETLVSKFGDPYPGNDGVFSFPSPSQIATSDELTLRNEARLGYRAPYILNLAKQVDTGELDLEMLKSPDLSSKEVFKQLLSIRGVGNYAAANLMMLLGHYEYLPIDSWALKLVSDKFFDGEPIEPNQVEEVFESWGEWKGLAYWLWNWSED